MEPGGVFSISTLTVRPGYIVLRIKGKKAHESFVAEAGGHRWQRVPPTEKRGRTQTSSITVAVLKEPENTKAVIEEGTLRFKATRGSGKGGQHRNKVSTAIQLKHEPSGIQVFASDSKSQRQNLKKAKERLKKKLSKAAKKKARQERNRERVSQIGQGWRGGKIRTIRVKDNAVVDHQTGRKMSFKRYERGYLEELII